MDFAWKCMDMHGYAWKCMNMHERAMPLNLARTEGFVLLYKDKAPWPSGMQICMDLHGLAWFCIDVHEYA